MNIIAVSQSYLQRVRKTSFLSKDELQEMYSISKMKQMEWLLGRFALKYSYNHSRLDKTSISYNSLGQPVMLDNPGMKCSISHSNTIGVGVVAEFQVGIDIEKIRSHNDELLEYISSKEERRIMQQSDPSTLVTSIWVLKEAVAKAVGYGIDYDVSDIMIANKESEVYTIYMEANKWKGLLYAFEQYLIAFVVPERMVNSLINTNPIYLQ